MSFELHAWVDESIHARCPEVPEGMYVLAAVVADPAECESTRQLLCSLLPGRARRLHWRDESAPLRRKVALAIGGSDFASVVVVGVHLDHRKQERARRKCMEQLLFELEQPGVSQVWIEARTESLNSKDRALVDAFRGSGAVSEKLRVDFDYPSTEPMLWVADAIAGAVGMARKGADLDVFELLGDVIQVINIEL